MRSKSQLTLARTSKLRKFKVLKQTRWAQIIFELSAARTGPGLETAAGDQRTADCRETDTHG